MMCESEEHCLFRYDRTTDYRLEARMHTHTTVVVEMILSTLSGVLSPSYLIVSCEVCVFIYFLVQVYIAL